MMQVGIIKTPTTIYQNTDTVIQYLDNKQYQISINKVLL